MSEKGHKKQKVLIAASVASMIEQFNLPNIKLLLNLGYEVHVACNFQEGNTCGIVQLQKLKEKLRGMHVMLHQWECPRDICAFQKCFRAYLQLYGLTGRYHYEWIHCHSPIGGALARLVAYQRCIRIIYTAHGFHFYKGAPVKNWFLYYPIEKILSCWTDVLVTVNLEDYCFAKRNLKAKRIVHIPGIGIEVEKFQNGCCGKSVNAASRFWQKSESASMVLRKKLDIPETALLLLSVGELSKRKNHQAVLRVLAKLPGKDIYYLICGQGPLRQQLLRKAKKLGIADRIRIPGYLEDVTKAYQAADIFVFPSLQEGMPVALMEAMASGLPCVVSDIRGNRELIGDRRCRFAPGCMRQLRTILISLAGQKELRDCYGKENAKNIRSYDISIVQTYMNRIYHGMEEA